MNQPEPQSIAFPTLMHNIEHGLVKIPQFQRDFVWPLERCAKLIDSILKGFPIGTFILWKTKESLRTVRNIGGAELPPTPPGDFVQHVLDGQQRLTSLYATYRGLGVQRAERLDDFSDIYIDLKASANNSEDEQVAIVGQKDREPGSVVRVVDLLHKNFAFLASYSPEHHQALEEYQQRLKTYSFSTVLVNEAPIEVATEIFTRINVSGKPLSVFEIMVAKTFDAEKDFDLGERYEELIEELGEVNYETISSAVVLQTVSAIIAKECAKKDILRLDKSKFIETWPKAKEAIHAAVEYFRNFYRIPVSKLLPYAALLVPFAYFFYHHPDRPSGDKQDYLEDLFWRVSLGGRYSFATEGRLAQDIRRVDEILEGELPKYDYPVDTSASFVSENGYFSANRSYVKAILCLLAYKQPKSFDNNALVNLSNHWLKQANSKNYHHFFPRAYLKKNGWGDWNANHIANITMVDDYLNKRKIKDKAPATYMKDFDKINSNLSRTMRSHLIDVNKFGIWENDYDTFFEKRCKAISRELTKRVIHRDVDDSGQEVHTDDFEETEMQETEV